MDNKALAETMTDLYTDIESHYEKKTSGKPTAEQTNTIFDQCAKIIMTDMINKRPQGVPSQQSSAGGDKPTDKQIMFAEKLGCKDPGSFTKKDLSAWIEEHKTW